eukprot:jgi/Bigna1/126102/aug1.2_g810
MEWEINHTSILRMVWQLEERDKRGESEGKGDEREGEQTELEFLFKRKIIIPFDWIRNPRNLLRSSNEAGRRRAETELRKANLRGRIIEVDRHRSSRVRSSFTNGGSMATAGGMEVDDDDDDTTTAATENSMSQEKQSSGQQRTATGKKEYGPLQVVVENVVENGISYPMQPLPPSELLISSSDQVMLSIDLQDAPFLGIYRGPSQCGDVFAHVSGRFKLFFNRAKCQWIVGLDVSSEEGFLYNEAEVPFAHQIDGIWRIWFGGKWKEAPEIKISKSERKVSTIESRETKQSSRISRNSLIEVLEHHLRREPLQFLHLYGDAMTENGLDAIARKRRVTARNRRYKRMKQLEKTTAYFEESSIRNRAPGLFHELIGRFLGRNKGLSKGSTDTGEDIKINSVQQQEGGVLLGGGTR